MLTMPSVQADAAPLRRRATEWAVIGTFLILAGVVLDLAKPVLVPTISAIVIGIMLGPLATRAERRGVPDWLTALVLLLLVLGLINLLIVFVSAPMIDWAQRLPEISKSIRDKLYVFDRPFAAWQELRRAFLPAGGEQSGMTFDVMSIVQPVLGTLTPAAGELLVFVGVLYFFLLTRAELRRRLVVYASERRARLRNLRILNALEANLTRYLATVTLINISLGIVAGCAYAVIGVPNAAAWGVLAFVLNYIPYVGPLIMEIILFGVGLVAFPTLTQALIPPAVHLGLSLVEGHLLTPAIIGRRLILNPLAVFLALVFWTWLWGPVGAFLAVPLLIAAQIILRHLGHRPEAPLPG